MKLLNLIIILFTFVSCFSDSGDEESGGGLFADHKPVVNSFTLSTPTNKTYIVGETLNFQLTHPYAITVTGTPRIQIDLGGSTVYANYTSGDGSKNLTFTYTVVASDNDNNGIEISGAAVDLNGGTLKFSLSGVITDTVLGLASQNTSGILVDTQAPSITAIIPTNSKTYFLGETLQFIVNFDEAINITGNPSLQLDFNGTIVDSVYSSGSGSNSLTFTYDIIASDLDLNGIAMVSPLVLNTGTISDSAGNNSNLVLTPIPMPITFVNGDAPFVTSFNLPTEKSYYLGQMVQLDLVFNEVINITGTPSIDFNLGGATKTANYLSGTGTNTITFNYIVSLGEVDTDGIIFGNIIAENGGTIQDVAANGAILNISPPLTPNVLINGKIPTITNIAAPSDANYLTAQNLDFTITFDEIVIISNIPRIEIALSSGNIFADYQSGSGTKDLVFSYTVLPANNDNDGVLLATTGLDLNTTGTIISQLTTQNANLLYNALEPTMTGVKVNEVTSTQLVITTEPVNTIQNASITPAITVEIRDVGNSLVATATDNVTLAFGTDPSAGAATLGGTITVAAIAGVATFSDINIDTVNTGYTLVASSGVLTNAVSTTFNITTPVPTQLAFIAQPINTIAGVNISPSITVEIRDGAGTIVNTATDNVTLVFGTDASAGAATLGGTLTVAAVAGVATFSDINIDKAFTGYTLNATSGVLTLDTSSNFDITPAAASQLVYNVEPVDTDYNTNITPAIVVEIHDAFGNLVNSTDSIVLAINNNPSAGTLAGTLTQAATAGVASFNDIQIDNIGVGYTLNATSGILTLATSASFDINATPTQLIITSQPVNTASGDNFTPAITVEIRDAANNIVNSATDSVTLAFGTDPSAGAAVLSGTVTVAAISGIATFSDINIDALNTGYTFDFTSGVLTNATSNTFDIVAAVPTQLVITTEPVNTVAGVSITPSIVVELRDASNNLVNSATDNVTIAFGTDASTGTATLGGTLTVAAIAGVATFSDINIDKAFSSYTIALSSGVLTGATSSSFDITPAIKAQLGFSTEPLDANYNTNITPAIVVEIQDAFGNKTADTDSIILVINNNPSAGTLAGTTTIAAVSGAANFSDIQIDNVGIGYTLNATSGALTLATSAAFNINAVPTQLVMTTAPINTDRDVAVSPAIVVEIRDASNNLVLAATDNITLAFGTDPSAGSANIGGTITVAAVAGIATFSDIAVDTVNTGYTLVASSGVLTDATSPSFNIDYPAPTQLAITAEPIDTVAGVNITPSIVVELRDAAGNITETATDNVTIAFGTDASTGSATLGGTLTVAAIAGVATFSDINIDKAFSGYTLNTTSGVLTNAVSTTFTITPAVKAQLGFKVDPSDTAYNTNIAPAIEVEIQDAFGNKTTDTDSISLVINNNPNAGTLAGTTSVAATLGAASFSDIQIDNTGVGYTLNATSGALTLATSGAFNIIATPTQLIITGQPSNTDRNANISPDLTVEIRDASNNLVTDETSNVTLAIGTDPSAGSALLNGTVTVAAVAGVATFSNINLDTVNSGYTLIASSGVLTTDTSSAFNITYPVATQLAVTTEPSNTVAGVNISSSIIVEIRDAAGNLVETSTDNVTIAFGTDASAGSATLAGTLTIAAVAGVATFSDINIDKAFNSYTLSMSSGVLTGATSNTFNVSAAVKAQLGFTTEPVDTNYNTNIAPAIVVEIQDAFGNKTSDTDSITLVINNNPGAGTLAGTTSVAAINGAASFADIQIDNVGIAYTLNATSGALTLATSTAFNINATATQLVITNQPTDADRGGSIAPAITVEIRDASNNLVLGSTDNVTLAFGTDPSAGAATLGGTLTVAAVAGVATFSTVNIDTVNTGYTLVASSGSLTDATSSAFNILMPAPTQLIITTQPSDTIAGASNSPSITIEIRDASGNLVETNTDNVTLTFGTDASAGAATLGGTLTVAAVAGIATFSDITIDKAFNSYTLAATSGVLTGATSGSFNISASVKAKLGFSVEPSNATNIATNNPSIVVDILDTYGNKTADTDSVTLSFANDASAGSATLAGSLTIPAIAGSATFSDININIAAVGYTLNAASGGLISATSTSFNITQVPTKLAITQEPSNAQFNVAINPSIIVAIQDSTSSTVVGATDAVTLTIGTDPSAGSAVIAGTLTVNAVNGLAIFNDISIDALNNGYTFNFSSGSLTGTTSTSFNIFDTTLVFDSVATVNFGNISLGDTADATLLINHSGGTATTITETTLAPPFDFKNGSYPGTGGTCSASVTTNCTIVLTYTPTTASTSNGTVTINYNGSNSTSRPLTGTGVSTTPTKLSVFGPTGVITNSCIPYIVQSVDSNGDVGNVASNETVSLLINNGTGDFYSDAVCGSIITSTIISSGSSSKTIYFKSATSAQSLTLIFNGATLTNTSKAVTTSVEPTFISANIPNEIVTDTCTLAEVSLVDPNGVKTGSSTSKTVNFTENGDVLVYTDSFCTNLVTSLNYAAYEGSKFIYLKNATVETITFNFTDAGAVLSADSSNVSFVASLTWADSNYSKRVRIAINNLDIPDTFSNMPILVKLDSSKINYADMLANGNDMRFYLDDHTTPLSYSIDTWDASGVSYIWVKVDTVAANSELNIYMYYSNGTATNAENSNGIWGAYEGVWLMNKTGATYNDETPNARNGSANGTLTDISGPVGNAVNFDGASTLKLTYDLSQVLGGTSTLSFWMKTSQTGDNTDWKAPGLVGLSGTAATQDLFYSFINASGNIGSSAGGGTAVQSNFVVNDNTWRYVTVSRNSTTGEFRYYVNGVLNGSGNSGTGLKTQPFFDFGATTKLWGGGGFFYYIGGMDSIRISSSVQTDNRVKAEYKFTTDTHVQFSSPEDL